MNFFQINDLTVHMPLWESCLWPWKKKKRTEMYSAKVCSETLYLNFSSYFTWGKNRRNKDLFLYEICLVSLPKIRFLLLAEAKPSFREMWRKWQNPFLECSHPLAAWISSFLGADSRKSHMLPSSYSSEGSLYWNWCLQNIIP